MAYGNGTNAPYGLKPVMTLTGAPWTESIRTYRIASAYPTSIFQGDPVIPLNDGTIGIGVAGSVTLGIFNGCQYYAANGQFIDSPYWPASTSVLAGSTVKAYVICDPHVIYSVQTNNATGLTLTQINNNANFAIATGSTATGQSATVLDLSSANTTSTLNLKILDLDPAQGNDFSVAYNSVLVTINNSFFNAGVAGI